MTVYPQFRNVREDILRKFKRAPIIQPKMWQGRDVSMVVGSEMIELLHESFRVQLTKYGEDLDGYRRDIAPNLPWADDHFEERVCGYPINPGIQWKKWPWGNKARESLDLDGDRFNHNYMERYWPKYAGVYNNPRDTPDDFLHGGDEPQWVGDGILPNEGIRGELGDLNDFVERLAREPDTRQAYFPIFFPEDTMVDGRKPCTLGYHFIQRHGYLHVTYYMRSCDFYRHWADDCYLTIRLMMWILDRCRKLNPDDWGGVKPGFFIMHITSLHMFLNDGYTLGILQNR